ncbi:DUF3489 domain-containing protein [Mesorhizobium sp. AR02]|uniref:DUF3489 domain-containing protein n=1 Tax=Mesorhizobium sp. AR02 TaxID=2865837 RepID=UPI00215E5829|nr:DUF3489 domain-containing protein [Mesorhizobium sp. AR02]UVK55382.1 DUF3489 domain-containing protein [Mesorhizobium sp. AR02]
MSNDTDHNISAEKNLLEPAVSKGNGRTKGGGKAAKAEAPAKAGKATKPGATKADLVLKKLATPKGASLRTLAEATGWQTHSVRGFLSGTVKKKLGQALISEVGKDGTRRYRIADTASGA